MRTSLAAALLPVLFLAACGAGEPIAGGTSTASSEEPAPTVPPLESAQLYEADATVLEQGGGMSSPSHGPELCFGGVALSLPPQCGGVPIPNWDWDAVEGEESASGTTWGVYHVVGTYDGEVFTVTEVSTFDPKPESDGSDRDFTTPCPEPEGGWIPVDPSRVSEEDFDAAATVARSKPDFVALWVDYVGDFTDEEMTEMAIEDRLPPKILNAVFAGSVTEHEPELRELWGGPMCLTQREAHTESELMAIRKEAETFIQDELGLEFTWSAEGDVGLAAEVGVVIDVDGKGQVALDERYGPGMVRLFPALTPVEQ